MRLGNVAHVHRSQQGKGIGRERAFPLSLALRTLPFRRFGLDVCGSGFGECHGSPLLGQQAAFGAFALKDGVVPLLHRGARLACFIAGLRERYARVCAQPHVAAVRPDLDP